MVKIRILLFLLLPITFESCRSNSTYKLYKTPNLKNQLKLNGYYIKDSENEKDLRHVYFFYKTGLILYGYSYSSNETVFEIENQLKKVDYSFQNKRNRPGTGLFQIDDDEIAFETWEPSAGGPLKTAFRKGRIIDNSTFIITQIKNNYSNKEFAVNDVYKFHLFSPKPDSTNVFIE
jgi:hypothetical protein